MTTYTQFSKSQASKKSTFFVNLALPTLLFKQQGTHCDHCLVVLLCQGNVRDLHAEGRCQSHRCQELMLD